MASPTSRSFYRDIFTDAWHTAWQSRIAWLLAIGAGVLQTGGIVDVLYRLIHKHLLQRTESSVSFTKPAFIATIQRLLTAGPSWLDRALVGAQLVNIFLLALLCAVTVLALVLICQGALVYMIGARGRFTKPTLGESLAVGGGHIWRTAALAFLPFIAFVFSWFVFLGPFGVTIQLTSVQAVLGYVIAIIASLIVGFLATSLQMLALQFVVLDDAHVEPALKQAWSIIRRSWLTLVEASVFLFVIGVAVFILSILSYLVLILPLLALAGAAIVFQSATLATFLLLFAELLFVIVMLSVGGAMIVFQYAVWNRLSTRLVKNLAVAKIVRVVHQTLDRIQSR